LEHDENKKVRADVWSSGPSWKICNRWAVKTAYHGGHNVKWEFLAISYNKLGGINNWDEDRFELNVEVKKCHNAYTFFTKSDLA